MSDVNRPGFVYVLSNEHMPYCFKIGKTLLDLKENRIDQLSSATGIPADFIREFGLVTPDGDTGYEVEGLFYDTFQSHRINKKEFVHCFPKTKEAAAQLLREIYAFFNTIAITSGGKFTLLTKEGLTKSKQNLVEAIAFSNRRAYLSQRNVDFDKLGLVGKTFFLEPSKLGDEFPFVASHGNTVIFESSEYSLRAYVDAVAAALKREGKEIWGPIENWESKDLRKYVYLQQGELTGNKSLYDCQVERN